MLKINLDHSDILDPPHNPHAVAIRDQRMTGRCVILAEWNPPLNTEKEDVAFYMIQYPSGNMNSTASEVSFLVRIPTCTQDIEIRVSAVNRCGREGRYSQLFEPSLIDTDSENDPGQGEVLYKD